MLVMTSDALVSSVFLEAFSIIPPPNEYVDSLIFPLSFLFPPLVLSLSRKYPKLFIQHSNHTDGGQDC